MEARAEATRPRQEVAAEPPPKADDGTDRPAPETGTAARQDELRAQHGVRVVYAGLAVVLGSFVAAVIAYAAAADVSTALAPVTGVVGTIVGAYFGVQVGSQGKDTAEQRADQRVKNVEQARHEAELNAMRMAAVAPPESAAAVLDIALPPRAEPRASASGAVPTSSGAAPVSSRDPD